ncbi:asparagine synthase-related protein [Streptomyces sp. WM6378]|uniref:asparagine synthase-related protein n=1 Tax=Streptomyces sp. WM6378 TaxID=1415557 RepID=UPI0006ADAAA9|nr:asparagine synthase-related protein [Streptomyces sp. WM6378]KOU50070.1 hypothetical protein ADK54_09830 [Streptomyces sp. WM6378]
MRETVTSAVTRRTTGTDRLSTDLSGGIDSSVITSLAAPRTPLLAVTYTDDRMGEQDDVRYAERIAAGNPAIEHAWVHGTRDGVQHFDALDDPAALPLTDAPALSLGLLAIKTAQLAPATAYGSHLHLTGRGGDNVLDALPMAVIDQYRVSHRLAAVGQTARFARARHTALWPMLQQAARTQHSSQPRALAALAALLGGSAVHACARPHRRSLLEVGRVGVWASPSPPRSARRGKRRTAGRRRRATDPLGAGRSPGSRSQQSVRP